MSRIYALSFAHDRWTVTSFTTPSKLAPPPNAEVNRPYTGTDITMRNKSSTFKTVYSRLPPRSHVRIQNPINVCNVSLNLWPHRHHVPPVPPLHPPDSDEEEVLALPIVETRSLTSPQVSEAALLTGWMKCERGDVCDVRWANGGVS